jgi:hypothetical protein
MVPMAATNDTPTGIFTTGSVPTMASAAGNAKTPPPKIDLTRLIVELGTEAVAPVTRVIS